MFWVFENQKLKELLLNNFYGNIFTAFELKFFVQNDLKFLLVNFDTIF